MSILNNTSSVVEHLEPKSTGTTNQITVIRPSKGFSAINFAELWQYRDLLITLGLRDVKLRYRQTALGVVWVVLQPLLTSVVFTVVFGLIAKVPTKGVPQFLLSYVGMLAWSIFSGTLTRISTSMVGNAQLVSKIYFPRLILPLSTTFSVLVDFAVAAIVLIPLLFVYHAHISLAIFLAPIFLVLLLLLSLGIGLYAAALTVSYRDIQYVVPFLLQLLLYGSPVNYMVSVVGERLPSWVLPFFFANPLVGLLEGFRWSIIGGEHPDFGRIAYSAMFSIVVFFIGLYSFKSMERKFADVI